MGRSNRTGGGPPCANRYLFSGVVGAFRSVLIRSSSRSSMAPPSLPQAPCACRPFSWTGFYLGGNLGAGMITAASPTVLGFFSWGADSNTTFVGGSRVRPITK